MKDRNEQIKVHRKKVGTTLDKDLLEKIQELAEKENMSFNELVEEGMKLVLQDREGKWEG